MRIDVIYGLAIVPEATTSLPSTHVLRYTSPTDPEDTQTFVGVVLAPLADDAQSLDVTAFDAINGLIDDASEDLSSFDDWLANDPEGQRLHELGHRVAPAVLIVYQVTAPHARAG